MSGATRFAEIFEYVGAIGKFGSQLVPAVYSPSYIIAL